MANENSSECAVKRKCSQSPTSGDLKDCPDFKRVNTSVPYIKPRQSVLNTSPYSTRIQMSTSFGVPATHAQSVASPARTNRFYVPPFGQKVCYTPHSQNYRKTAASRLLKESRSSPINRPSVPAFGQVTAPKSTMVYNHVPQPAPGVSPFQNKSSKSGFEQIAGLFAQTDERVQYEGIRDRQDTAFSSDDTGYLIAHQWQCHQTANPGVLQCHLP